MMRAASLLLLELTTTSVRAVVTYPNDHDVHVTFTESCGPSTWTCSTCGPSYGPTCPHTSATEYAVRAHDLLNPDGRNTP